MPSVTCQSECAQPEFQRRLETFNTGEMVIVEVDCSLLLSSYAEGSYLSSCSHYVMFVVFVSIVHLNIH